MPKTKPTKKLVFKPEYEHFFDFFESNKGEIYKAIVEIFELFKTVKKNKLSLQVNARISEFSWKADFHFFRDESIVLERDLLPYFEQIEDYETCEQIKILHKELTKKN